MTAVLLLLAFQAAQPAIVLPAPKPALICRDSEQETGSHIHTGRRCKTQEDWEREDADRTRVPPSLRVTEGQGDALTKQRPQ